MSPLTPKKQRKVTDKKKKCPAKMTDLTLDEAIDVSNAMSSTWLWETRRLLEVLQTGAPLNRWEIEAMDRVIKEYNLKYKSPLALALSEKK